MAQKRSSNSDTRLKSQGNKAGIQPHSENKVVTPKPLMSHGKPVVVKDLLGSFSEQTGASFG